MKSSGQTSDSLLMADKGNFTGPWHNPLLEAALAYASRGWPVLPVWWVEEGRCACGADDCHHPGKHPLGKLVPHGRKDATVETSLIRAWWTRYPRANIGILTGLESGIIVVDIDPRNGGTESKRQLELLGNFPHTPSVITGGDGEHFFMKHPDSGQYIKSRPKLGAFPGIDLKGDGGYVVAPPSNHISGKLYTWAVTPDTTPPAEIPEWLMTLILQNGEPQKQTSKSRGEKIARGRRNTDLTSLAGTMRRRGMSPNAIEAALLLENQRCDPPLPEAEVRQIANSVSRYEPATEGDGAEPEPLRRTPEPGEPFPVEALGNILGEAASIMHSIIKAPLAICGQSVLATANLAVQGHADVFIDGRSFPVSEFFLSVALSGDRKSAADRTALSPVEGHQRVLLEEYQERLPKFKMEYALWKADHDEAMRKKDSRARREAMKALPPTPASPFYPQLTTEEPTYEGLTKLLLGGWPSIGLFSDEGGRFFGGYAMSPEHRLKTLAGLSDLWDGRPLTRTRATDGAIILYGRRCCAHFLMQPLIAETILSDPLAHDQGFLSRCLIVAPESTLGCQQYSDRDMTKEEVYKRYVARISQILQAGLPLKNDPLTNEPTNELVPRLLPLSPEAKTVWVRFHDWVQSHLGVDGIFRPIAGIAGKAAEHALRLAGTLTLLDDLNAPSITIEHMKNGIVLARFYLTEALRLLNSARTNPDLISAEKVLDWLRTREKGERMYVSLPEVYQFGPNVVRDKSTALKAIHILVDHGWLRPLEGGGKVGGKHRKQVWEVHHRVFQGSKI